MGDPLSAVSAIIGIIAAAGKVAELLGPLVSSVKDAKNTAREIQNQVEESRAILQALQKLFDDLEQFPRRRRELIQIDQLRATLCDGTVIFSELEPLVVQLSTSNESLRSRVQWARKRDQLEAFRRRLDRFKSSINTMLNILQCESDMDAAANRQELYNLTSQLLQSNRDLRRRLSLLERGPRDDGDSVHLQIGQRSSLVSIRSQIRAFEFERDLKESWVYRKARRSTADASFRSSNALSHAWSALSDISLSDISAISIVALPISPDDLSNGHHYRQGQGQPGGSSSQQQEKELVIGPPTLLTSTYPWGLSPLASPSRGTIDPESFGESRTEKDAWVPQHNQAGIPLFFNTRSGLFCLWDPNATPRTLHFSFIPQVNEDGKLFYYNQATKIRTETLPANMALFQKEYTESHAQSLLALFATFRHTIATQTQVSPTGQASMRPSPTPSAGESLRTPPLANSPRLSLEGLDTALGSIGDVRREKEEDGLDPVPLTELSNMEVSVSPSPAETLSQGSKTGGFTRFPREYMLAIVGGGRVGKSDLAVQFIHSQFADGYDPSIQDSYRKQCTVDDEPTLLDVLDTAGQEEYSGMREQYMRTGEGFMIVYSITSRASFEETMSFQQQILRVKDRDYFPMILVGNHSDREIDREVSSQEGRQLAKQFGCPFIEVSAKSGINIDDAFYDLVREIRRWDAELAASGQIVGLHSGPVTKEQKTVKRRKPRDWLKRSRRNLSMDVIEERLEITTPTTQGSPGASMPAGLASQHTQWREIDEGFFIPSISSPIAAENTLGWSR